MKGKEKFFLEQEKNEGFLPTARPLINRWWEGGGKKSDGAEVEVRLGRV